MKDFIENFKATLNDAENQLKQISVEDSAVRPAPEKWSKKEILGHLVDSAFNNHRRFVTWQFQENLVFSGYQQDKWVAVQNYQDEDWESLILLWKSINLHILHVIPNIPSAALTKIHTHHSFDKITWMTLDKNSPATLEYLIEDYLVHMKHHLKQIFDN